MTILAIGYDVYAIIFISILAAVLIVLFSRGNKSSRKNGVDDEQMFGRSAQLFATCG